jgi:hypothetical protein
MASGGGKQLESAHGTTGRRMASGRGSSCGKTAGSGGRNGGRLGQQLGQRGTRQACGSGARQAWQWC